MSKGPPASPELIEAIRRCAYAKKSYAVTADELTTRLHPLSRSAVAGIAKRNGITFRAKRAPGSAPRKPKDRRTIPGRLPASKPRPNFVTERVRAYVAPPRASCSWAGCTEHAEPADMFCFKHGRKGLMA